MPSTVLGRSGRGGVRATRTVWAWNSLAMFSVDDRRALRQQVIDRASDDDHVTACVLFGSAARGEEDTWSDIDIALQLGRGVALEEVTNLWKAWLGDVANVADTLAIHASGALYRVFLLSNLRQLDLSFWPHDHLRSTGMPVQPIFGTIGGSRARGRGGVRGGSWPWSVCVPGLGGVRRGQGRKQTKARNLLERLRDREPEILRFTDDLAVPFTNNGSERDLRPVKTQVKISGCHRATTGAQAWLRIRGYISTVGKHGDDVLTALHDAITGNPWQPESAPAT